MALAPGNAEEVSKKSLEKVVGRVNERLIFSSQLDFPPPNVTLIDLPTTLRVVGENEEVLDLLVNRALLLDEALRLGFHYGTEAKAREIWETWRDLVLDSKESQAEETGKETKEVASVVTAPLNVELSPSLLEQKQPPQEILIYIREDLCLEAFLAERLRPFIRVSPEDYAEFTGNDFGFLQDLSPAMVETVVEAMRETIALQKLDERVRKWLTELRKKAEIKLSN